MYVGTAIGKINSPYVRYHSTDNLLSALNYNTTGMTILEDFSAFNNLKVNGIDGSGTVTLSYLKSHVAKKNSSYITSDDVGRSISVEFLGKEPMVAEIVEEEGDILAFFNFEFEAGVSEFPAYAYMGSDYGEEFYVMLENPTEEDTFNVVASFVDTGDVIFDSTATFYMVQSGLGYVYLVNLPIFNITSTLDHNDDEIFNFSNMTYWNMGAPYVILGNGSIISKDLPSNSDTFFVAIGMIGSGTGNGAMGYFLSANPPYSEDFALPMDVMEEGVDYWLNSICDETGLEEFDIYTALLSDVTINEAYVIKGKLDSKYVDIDAFIKPAGRDDDEIGGIYVRDSYNSGLYLDTSDGELKVSGSDAARIVSSYLAGTGLQSSGSQLNVNNASNTTVGGIKIAAQDGVLYISNDGSNPIR